MRIGAVVALMTLSAMAEGSPPDSARTCPTTRVTGIRVSNEAGTLSTSVGDNGTVTFKPGGPGCVDPDGALGMKWPWWRGVRGELVIEGRRLDGQAPPLRAAIPRGYGPAGFQSTGLLFPTAGCWEVTGRVADEHLTFVVFVEKIGAGPSTGCRPLGIYERASVPARR
jgi:hypothetical protein